MDAGADGRAHRPGFARRWAGLGLEAATRERARELAVEALRGGRRATRAELFAGWAAAGISPDVQRGAHLLLHLALTGTVCYGPKEQGRQQLVLLEEWVPAPRRLEREEALGEWALRYFRSHGPATLADLTRWTGLTLTDARAGLALARPALAALDVDGTEHLMDPATPERLAGCRNDAVRVLLLPGFDELLLGYRDRSAVLPPEHADRTVPGGNGMFLPTVVADGRVVGVWRHRGRTPGRGVEATPFTSFAPEVAEALPAAYAALP